MKRARVVLSVPIVVAVLLAGCGGGSNSSSTATSSAAASTPTQTSSTPSTTSSTASSTPAVLITTKHAKLGTILATGSKKLTVYLFEADKGSASSCSGQCAKVWPPVIGKPRAAGGAMAADLSTIKRSDGKTQVAYKGHPLYLYVKDEDAGDSYGQGSQQFGAGWYVLAPSGKKIDNS